MSILGQHLDPEKLLNLLNGRKHGMTTHIITVISAVRVRCTPLVYAISSTPMIIPRATTVSQAVLEVLTFNFDKDRITRN